MTSSKNALKDRFERRFTPEHPEINKDTIKLLIGIIAISLAYVTNYYSSAPLTSISASYHEDGMAHNVFVGFLFAIAAFMVAYNGKDGYEWLMAKAAGLSALGVAIFPCGCGVYSDEYSTEHVVSAVFMFVILTIFCFKWLVRARNKEVKDDNERAGYRAVIYAICGTIIVTILLILGTNAVLDDVILTPVPRLVFFGEKYALVAFGVAWLTGSHIFPIINDEKERLRLYPFKK